jgi:purine-binding chemotaxis protein CheW
VNIEEEQVEVGALVDSVQEVIEVEDNQIYDPPSVGSKYKSEYISGILKVKDKFMMLLDIDKIFATDKAISLKEID